MHLVGMMDSPYVRRVAVSMRLLGLAHRHDQVSVFRHMDRFRAVNPVIKAPTLVLDDGTVLMDSTLILELVEAQTAPRSLMPSNFADKARALSLIGFALAGCEKAIQIEYERKRPEDIRYAPWLERVQAQADAAFAHLDRACAAAPDWLVGETLTQADVTLACVWAYAQLVTPDAVPATRYPRIAAHAARCETLPAFIACPLI
ncbi:MAG: glutathione S-transferase [Methylobacteriaceae bacterium]|nr:glutathione S-transferase [Methylobacteriaceae bacterium]